MELRMSSLPKTWILDLDGTIVKHNGYKIDGADSLLPGAENLLEQIGVEDCVIFVTSRKLEYKESTEDFLRKHAIRFDHIIYEAPYGERILINDKKPSGLPMAYAINTTRDESEDIEIVIDPTL
ncbi:MAG: HAD family acid phosphatase [Lachnospiraceae bacterium]|nr:HAD family acid phosphatase [Lachnospiraceae bacterium]